MDKELVDEWLCFADSDLEAAQILGKSYPRYREIIAYHCQQAAEKYLKAFLLAHNIEPLKIHDLRMLCALCVEITFAFEEIKSRCRYLTQFGTQVRYPFEIDIDDYKTDLALEYAEKIKMFPAIAGLRSL